MHYCVTTLMHWYFRFHLVHDMWQSLRSVSESSGFALAVLDLHALEVASVLFCIGYSHVVMQLDKLLFYLMLHLKLTGSAEIRF